MQVLPETYHMVEVREVAQRLLRGGAARPQQRGAVDQQCSDGRTVQLCGRLRIGVDVQLRSALLLPLTAPRGPLCCRGRKLRTSQLVQISPEHSRASVCTSFFCSVLNLFRTNIIRNTQAELCLDATFIAAVS